MQRDTLVFRTLLAAARQRDSLDAPRCRVLLELLCAAHAANTALHRELDQLGLTELKFAALVVLFVLDPSPATPADLAAHTGVTRSAITDVLDHLEDHRLLLRARDTHDRRVIFLHLTDAGRSAAAAALNRYLKAADLLARSVPLTGQEQEVALRTFAQFHASAMRLCTPSVSTLTPST